MAKTLVTGPAGFIGRHLLPVLASAGHHVVELDRRSGDIADKGTWLACPSADVVIHLAGKTFVPESWSDPAGFLETNLHGTVRALDYCKAHGAKLIFLSSYLYGNPERLPIPESAALRATNPYALSKKLAEEACRFYSDKFGVRVTVLRPFNVYGSGQPRSFLIPSLMEQAAAGETIHVQDLEPRRDYVYIDDLVDSIARAVVCDDAFNVFNIGTGVSYSVAELIALVQEAMGTDLAVQSAGERRPDEVMETRAGIAKAEAVLGWKPKWTLQQGLLKMRGDVNAPGVAIFRA